MAAIRLYETRVYQDIQEHDAFIALQRAENVHSYLEIGLGAGGSLWRIANALPKGSRIVGIDLHIATDATNRANIEDGVARLNERGYDAHLIAANSQDPATIGAARQLGPFDCIFIDGSHTYDGVKADWTNYGEMGRIIAFHDISFNSTWVSAKKGKTPNPIFVPLLWNEIKDQFRHREIRFNKLNNYYGIGVIWREEPRP